MRTLCLGLAVVASAGCSRPPLGEFCPDLSEGELVITEIRGPQTGGDNRGQWFEVYNASDRAVDLRGLRIEFYNLQGARPAPARPILVRAEAFSAQPGQYVTFGHHDPAVLPDFVDYTFINDYFGTPSLDADELLALLELGLEPEDFEDRLPKDLERGGRIDLVACDVLIDRVRYTSLPSEGTLSFDGDLEPDAEDNDQPENFCTDEAEEVLEPGEPRNFIGLPGSPQEENPACVK